MFFGVKIPAQLPVGETTTRLFCDRKEAGETPLPDNFDLEFTCLPQFITFAD
jgi:hypothetical protein